VQRGVQHRQDEQRHLGPEPRILGIRSGPREEEETTAGDRKHEARHREGPQEGQDGCGLRPRHEAQEAQTDRQALTPWDTEFGTATSLLPNASFLPPETGASEAPAFQGPLSVHASLMPTDPAEFTSREALGEDHMIFPTFNISFITVNGDLVPATQEVIRVRSLPGDKSFWDLIVQPGRVWEEEGDGEWSRSSFPFALMHSIEGETHNGVAMFFYRDGEVSGLRYQILTQTAPFYMVDYFTASGISESGAALSVRHGQPVRMTNQIASIARRAGTGGRPPRG
jgi:hypothetical protein